MIDQEQAAELNKTKELPPIPAPPLKRERGIGALERVGESERALELRCVWNGRRYTIIPMEYFRVGRPRSIECCNVFATCRMGTVWRPLAEGMDACRWDMGS